MSAILTKDFGNAAAAMPTQTSAQGVVGGGYSNSPVAGANGYISTPPAPNNPPIATILHKALESQLSRLHLLTEQQEGLINRLFGPRPQNPDAKNATDGGTGTLADISRSLNIMDSLLQKALENQAMLTRLG